MLYFDHAIFHTSRTNNNLPRNTNQIHAGELCARAFISVIKQRIEAARDQFFVQVAGSRITNRVARFQIDHNGVEWSHLLRPDDALLVVVLLDGRRDRAAAGAAESADTWGVSASYDFGFMNLAADYSSTDEDDFETTQYNLAAVFAVAATTDVALGMGNKEEDDADDVTEWYANVTYKFPAAKNVSVFAEIAQSDLEDASGDDADMGFLAGMRVKF